MYTYLSPDEIIWLAVLPVTTVIALAGIWFGKRWGIILAVIVFAAILLLDVYYKVWPHAILATVGFALLAFFCWQSRQYFMIMKES
jgi:hypothetical protein